MSKFRSVLLAAAILYVTAGTPAHAATAEIIGARVTLIEPTYMPDSIGFWIDKPVGACPAGAFLRWYARGADAAAKTTNVNAIYSGLVTAMTSGKTVNLSVEDSNCSVNFFQMNSN